MKKSHYILAVFITFFGFNGIFSQEFELVDIPIIDNTANASRSANFVDVNGDGWDDIFISNGPSSGQNNVLYINNGDGTFSFLESDITNDGGRSDGASFADVDNDGDLDAFVVTYGYGTQGHINFFYRNNGDGTFSYEPNVAMGSTLTFSEMCSWIDINNDQFLDLFITNSNGNETNLYYENTGDGNFEQINNLSITNESIKSRSIDWIDYDGDGDSDLFIANEDNENNSLFRNDGINNFVQITDLSFVTDNYSTAGSSWGDIDNDGDFDLFLANWENQANQLFINENGVFVEQTNSIIAEGLGYSFGSSFADIDNDGDLDLLVCNAYYSGQNKNFLYINDGLGNFTQDNESNLANHTGYTFGCAFSDYNHDGYLDVILANTFSENQANSLYENTGTGKNWVEFSLHGTSSNYSAVGALVKIKSTINGNETWQIRTISASSGYCSQNSYTVHFGLDLATNVEELIIQWPSGLTENYTNLNSNNLYVVEEGMGISTAIREEDLSPEISVFPNPMNDSMTLAFGSDLGQKIKVTILDNQSHVVWERNNITSKSIHVNTKNFSDGIYFLLIETDHIKQLKKIVIHQ